MKLCAVRRSVWDAGLSYQYVYYADTVAPYV